MAKSGQAAYDSGMRGNDKPKEKADPKAGKVREFRVEGSANGGFAVHVSRHEKPGKIGEVSNYQGPELHTHPHKEALIQHVGALADEMGAAAKSEKSVEKPKHGDGAPNPKEE